MKQLLVLSIVLLTSAVIAQDDFWEWQNPRPQGSNLRDVAMLDSATYFAIGDGGLVIKTTDDGTTWDIKNLPTRSARPLNAIAFSSDKMHGITVGDNGEIFFTTDKGITWAKAATPTTGVQLKDVCFATDLQAFVVGLNGTLVFSTDGGASWQRSPIELNEHLHSVSFLNKNDGFIAARYGSFFTTADGGGKWERREFPFGNSLYSVHMLNDRELIAGGEVGGVFLSNDSGKTWMQQPLNISFPINSVVRLSTDRALVASDFYGLFLTTDGGLTWVDKLTDFRKDNLKGLSFAGNMGVCVGSNGLILRTNDGGTSWYSIFEKVAEFETLRGVYCFDANTAVAVGSAIVRTTNGGKKWTTVSNPTNRLMRAVDFADNTTGYAVGDSGVLVKSTNQGQTWTEIPIPFKTQPIDVDYLDTDHGVILADKNTIGITVDGGDTWFVKNIETSYHLSAIAYLSPTTLIAAGTEQLTGGDIGRVLRSTDGGMTWEDVGTQLNIMVVTCMAFADTLTGYIGGYAGFGYEGFAMAAHTSDGGKTWEVAEVGVATTENNPIFAISAADRLRATAVGANGISIHTDDGGKTWKRIETNTRGNIWGVDHPDVTTATAVGYRATILRLTTYDVPLSVNDPVASSAVKMLTSIYPNPAQSSTSMLIDLEQADVVTIELLSIEGKLLRTFYRGLLAPGEQTIEANLNGLPSGSYLVSIRSSKSTEYERLVISK